MNMMQKEECPQRRSIIKALTEKYVLKSMRKAADEGTKKPPASFMSLISSSHILQAWSSFCTCHVKIWIKSLVWMLDESTEVWYFLSEKGFKLKCFLEKVSRQTSPCYYLWSNKINNGNCFTNFRWWISRNVSQLTHLPALPQAMTFPLLMLGGCLDRGNALVHSAYPSSAPQPPELELS